MGAGAANTQVDNPIPNAFVQGVWVLLTVRLDSSMVSTVRVDGGVKSNTQNMSFIGNDIARSLIYVGRSSWPLDAYANMDLAFFGVWEFNMTDSVFTALETRLGSIRDILNGDGSNLATESTAALNMTFSTCTCSVGYYGTSTGCLACLPDHYCAGGIAPQVSCEALISTTNPLICTICPSLNVCKSNNAGSGKWTTALAYSVMGLSGVILLTVGIHGAITYSDHRRRYRILDEKKFQNGYSPQPKQAMPRAAISPLNTAPGMLGNTMLGNTMLGNTIQSDGTLS
jgi:hypothetical protein